MIGEKIKAIRKSKGWTQQKLGKKAGLNPSIVQYIEAGNHEPRYAYVEYLLEAMGYRLEIVRIEE